MDIHPTSTEDILAKPRCKICDTMLANDPILRPWKIGAVAKKDGFTTRVRLHHTKTNLYSLVGGFNPFKIYESERILSPSIGMKKTTTTSN